MQGIPRLLVGGQVTRIKAQSTDRTAVCMQGRFVTFVVTGSLDATALAELLRDRLGCRDALTSTAARRSAQRAPRQGKLRFDVPGWPVPNPLVAVPGTK